MVAWNDLAPSHRTSFGYLGRSSQELGTTSWSCLKWRLEVLIHSHLSSSLVRFCWISKFDIVGLLWYNSFTHPCLLNMWRIEKMWSGFWEPFPWPRSLSASCIVAEWFGVRRWILPRQGVDCARENGQLFKMIQYGYGSKRSRRQAKPWFSVMWFSYKIL